jgi:hypothetical protein
MKLRYQWKTSTSMVENCPARYEVVSAEGGFVIQGKRLDAETRAQLRNLGPDETAVWVPADVITGPGKTE